MRIGIWCDYGFTLEPSEGIGVFVDNLARGLVRADPDCQILMMAHPGQKEVLAPVVASGDGRIRVVSGIRYSLVCRKSIRVLKKIRRFLGEPTPQRRFSFWADQTAKYFLGKISRYGAVALSQNIDSCDIWLLPYVGVEQHFSKPTVVVIHDLVCYHFPEMMSAAKLVALKQIVNRVTNRATLAACMSNFIRDNDLCGTLNLPPSRVRVIKPAMPDDIGCNSNEVAMSASTHWLNARGINGPFLFYPAAFRTYKNHSVLVQCLQLLKQRSTTPWKLVFTGIRKCPRNIRDQIRGLGLSEDVIVLGKVSRAELQYLYQQAFATVVPSLYEQGSFPVMEALASHCPVAASDIPSLREQCRCLGSDMLYFNPLDPTSVVRVIEYIQAGRDAVIEAQAHGFSRMKEHTWESSARLWMEVFEDALKLNEPIEAVQKMRNEEDALV